MLTALNSSATASAFSLWLMEHNTHRTPEPTGWPLLTMPIPAGAPMPLSDDIEWFPSLDDHLVRNPAQTFLLRVAGEGLAEAGIHDGDLLVMDRATPPLAGSVALVIVEGVAVLTRLSRDAQGRLRTSAAESGFGPPLDGATRVGVARWVIHRLWPGRLSS
ncbi:LexA family protein [Candidatus Competibacter denitrificans]|nr:S24 family peptidase [Candidatus Competibacter denitrificans]